MSTRLAALLAAMLLALAGCGGSDDDDGGAAGTTTAQETTAADGEGGGASGDRVSGEGYSFAVPEGWTDETEQFSGSAVNIDLAVAAESADGFASNINVIRETPPGDPSLDDVVSTFREQLESVIARDISDAMDSELDGDEAKTYTYAIGAEEGPARRGRQVVTLHDGAVYTITFTSLDDAFAADEAAFQAALDSWTWG